MIENPFRSPESLSNLKTITRDTNLIEFYFVLTIQVIVVAIQLFEILVIRDFVSERDPTSSFFMGNQERDWLTWQFELLTIPIPIIISCFSIPFALATCIKARVNRVSKLVCLLVFGLFILTNWWFVSFMVFESLEYANHGIN